MDERYTFKDYLKEMLEDLREGRLIVWIAFLVLVAGLLAISRLVLQ